MLFRSAQHGVLSFRIIADGAVTPVVKEIEPKPTHVIQFSVGFPHIAIRLCRTISVICFFYRGGLQGSDCLIVQKYPCFHQKMICRRDLGLPVKIVQLIPVKGRIGNRPAENFIDGDGRVKKATVRSGRHNGGRR